MPEPCHVWTEACQKARQGWGAKLWGSLCSSTGGCEEGRRTSGALPGIEEGNNVNENQDSCVVSSSVRAKSRDKCGWRDNLGSICWAVGRPGTSRSCTKR